MAGTAQVLSTSIPPCVGVFAEFGGIYILPIIGVVVTLVDS